MHCCQFRKRHLATWQAVSFGFLRKPENRYFLDPEKSYCATLNWIKILCFSFTAWHCKMTVTYEEHLSSTKSKHILWRLFSPIDSPRTKSWIAKLLQEFDVSSMNEQNLTCSSWNATIKCGGGCVLLFNFKIMHREPRKFVNSFTLLLGIKAFQSFEMFCTILRE